MIELEILLLGVFIGASFTFYAMNAVSRSFWRANAKKKRNQKELMEFVWRFHHKGLIPFMSTMAGLLQVSVLEMKDFQKRLNIMDNSKFFLETALIKFKDMMNLMREEVYNLENETTTLDKAVERMEFLIEEIRKNWRI